MRVAVSTWFFLAGRSLAMLAALCLIASGMASIHTTHALAGGHDMVGGHEMAHAAPQASSDCHAQGDAGASDTRPDQSFSCCAIACAPLMVLTQTPDFAAAADHSPAFIAAPPPQVISRALAGPFRPPRQNA